MAKLKSSAKKKTAPTLGEGLPRSIMDSAQQIWHAGMGAFGRAQEEGSRLFESLVKEGSGLEMKTRKLAGGKVDAVRDAVEHRVGAVKERAADTWDKLEKVFEDRVQRALVRLGVPDRNDLQALIARVDELNAELRKLGNATPAAARPAAKKAPARAAKKAPQASKTTKRAARAPAKRKAIKDLTD
ncbi:phasin family protein [Chiayiivirga flava]|uniref:Poly(Hydroxyalkanoate) granule-associated protein n=1 Tax=Chiayiivirga flava TaxID=659595 RepID=A0A7W8D4W8_9GAMM|nr:phasin family protein [Chiayiivirga flava]MBB5206717.1 poly(hydroxyalkanoate) granule-associated protein [Chiayiivirga flava]